MKIVRQGWFILIALITSGGTSIAATFTEDAVDGSHPETFSVRLMSSEPQLVTRHRIPVPEAFVAMLALRKAGAGRSAMLSLHAGSIQVNRILLQRDHLVLLGHRLVSQGIDRRGHVPVWLEEVRVTVPRQYIANSWDVLSLQRELERLGIKVKPKPPTSKPVQQLSG